MPENKLENVVFTVLMTFVMVYAMICYNIALNIGGLNNGVFAMAFEKELFIMWPLAIVLEMFVFERPIMFLTRRLVTENMPVLWIILIRSALTVCLMCPSMSFAASLLFKDFHTAGLISTWLQTAAMNFPMALAWQIFFAGPLVRLIFRLIFRRGSEEADEPSRSAEAA